MSKRVEFPLWQKVSVKKIPLVKQYSSGTLDDIEKNKKAFAQIYGMMEGNRNTDPQQGRPLPIVVIVNGPGGSGKDTFEKFVSDMLPNVWNTSSIEWVKEVAKFMMSQEKRAAVNENIEGKTDSYRTFLNDLKTAWRKFCNGAFYEVIQDVDCAVTSEENPASIIFIDIRELEEIESVKKHYCQNNGLMCLTLLIKGLHSPEEYTNPGDRECLNYDYDIIIENKPGDIEGLKHAAQSFVAAYRMITETESYKADFTNHGINPGINHDLVGEKPCYF